MPVADKPFIVFNGKDSIQIQIHFTECSNKLKKDFIIYLKKKTQIVKLFLVLKVVLIPINRLLSLID